MLNKLRRYIKNALIVNHKETKRMECLFTDVYALRIVDIEKGYQLASDKMQDLSISREERLAATLYNSLLIIKDNYTSVKTVYTWVKESEKRTTVPAGLSTYCKDVITGYEHLLTVIGPYTDFVQKLSTDTDLYSLHKLRHFVKDTEACLQLMSNNIESINYFLQNH